VARADNIHNHRPAGRPPRARPKPYPRPDFGRGPKPRPALEGRRVSVEQKVIEIVCEHLAVNKEQVTRNTNFIEDIGADSLDIVELIMELEEEFDIQIPDEQAEKIKTVGEAIDYIERETKKKAS
jgi:acyl carrier protein